MVQSWIQRCETTRVNVEEGQYHSPAPVALIREPQAHRSGGTEEKCGALQQNKASLAVLTALIGYRCGRGEFLVPSRCVSATLLS